MAVDVAKAAEENTKARHAEVVGALERTSEQLRAAAADRLRADFKDAQSAIAQLHERLGATQNSGEQSAASTG